MYTEQEKADLTKKIKSAEEGLERKFKKDIESLPSDYRSRV
jgi:hypothetical protein